MAQHVADTTGGVVDRGERQFMIDPEARDFRGVDKGINRIPTIGRGMRDVIEPASIAKTGGGLRDMYSGLVTGGDLHPFADPNKYRELAHAATQIPEADYAESLRPYLDYAKMSSGNRDTYMRNFMDRVSKLPPAFEDFITRHMR
jgi:hypothetical protein